jgi:LPXTG-motif cell wall-anchored protein
MARAKLIIGATLTAAALYGGSVAASDYPPDAPPPTTVVGPASGTHGSPAGPRPLANTGSSDAGMILEIGGAAVLAGAGLVVVARRRRRVAPA